MAWFGGTARAAVDAYAACAKTASTQLAASTASLDLAAETAETDMANSGDPIAAGDRAIAALNAAAARANDGDAGFCVAAGQAYWLGRSGNPYQARELLLEGFRLAQRSASNTIEALAAYRLGQVTTSSMIASSRGIRRSLARSPSISAADAPIAATDADPLAPCTLARDLDPSERPVAATSAALRCAVEKARDVRSDDLDARASLRLATFWTNQAAHDSATRPDYLADARRDALAALPAATRIPDPKLRAILLGRLVEAALDAGAPADPRLDTIADRMREAAGDDPSLSAAVLGIEARLALARGQRIQAAQLLRSAIFLEGQSPLPARLPDWYLLLADAEPASRDADLDAAFHALDAVRPLLGAYDPVTEQSTFALHVRPVFEALVDHELAGQSDDPEAIAQAQAVVEEYRQAEFQNVFGSACVSSRTALTPADLKPGETLLYPILLPDRIELIYAAGGERGETRYHRLPANRTSNRALVLALVARMVDSISFGDDDGWRNPARQLYDLLIAPVASRLKPDGTLIVVPDGALSSLPFDALVDPSGRFLVERTPLSVVPALGYAQPGGGVAPHDPYVVAAALEKQMDLPYGVFAALPAAGAEARDAVSAGEANPARNLVITNFRRADLARAFADRPVDVLHLATHASFNGRSDRSYIVADGELIPISELRDMIAQNQTRGAQLDLIVLSACETAVGDDEASMGLAGTAVQAGARSALASLWEVDDAATGVLMKTFYERFRATGHKAESLRDAQLAMIARHDSDSDPNKWAAFTLLGGWR
jgi:CHAT domain-containing protein